MEYTINILNLFYMRTYIHTVQINIEELYNMESEWKEKKEKGSTSAFDFCKYPHAAKVILMQATCKPRCFAIA